MDVMKFLALFIAGVMAFAFFGVTFSATVDDGVLRAMSFAMVAGMVSFILTLLVCRMMGMIKD